MLNNNYQSSSLTHTHSTSKVILSHQIKYIHAAYIHQLAKRSIFPSKVQKVKEKLFKSGKKIV